VILLGRMIIDPDTSFLNRRYRFSFKKFTHGVSVFIGLTVHKYKIKINQLHYYFLLQFAAYLNGVFIYLFLDKLSFFFVTILY
jgi:hypothetical protein